ncbi:amidophosphoribosyltransferase [Paenibacillus sp. J31TS4]|uniref:ComF family protein n=1 Tax=Paenibacillus sp. J31TS4 TaxID=2807195 RepID=UPI001B058A34|nr:phosphoribosyltransferase family protein [Paenibacillus sp. J31TS4]GIP40980.1 amidophosphoribosyltransferase [Paenibacillus sp. J31TS4]
MNRLSDSWAARLLRASAGLLAPPIHRCAACGNEYRERTNPIGLCRSCYAAAPWILRVRCPVCGRAEACPDCPAREATWFRLSRSSVRYDDTMKEWLAQYKYRGSERLGSLFGAMLVHGYQLLRQQAAEQEGCLVTFDCVTYAPVHPERLAERGFDQAAQLAAELGRRAGLPVLPLLARVRHTPKQSHHARRERMVALQGAFAPDAAGWRQLQARWAAGNAAAPGRGNAARSGAAGPAARRRLRVLVVDDVYTTGSTMNECARLLAENGPIDVYGLTWAR